MALQAAVGSASLLNFAGQRGFLGAGLGDLMPPGAADLVSPGFGVGPNDRISFLGSPAEKP